MLVRRVAMVVLAAALVAAGLQGPSARAASLSVVLQSGGSDAANRWVAVGAELGFSIRVSGGTPVSTRWRVDDTAVVAVSGQDDQATVMGRREGVTRLWVDVTGSDGVVVSDSCWVSVAVDVPDTPGAVVRKGAALYRSRTSQATSRGVLGANATATVLLVSGSWVRVVFADDFTFPADNDEPGRDAWVLTSSVDIPATSVTLDQEYLALPVGDSAELSASVKQSYANDYRLSWTSSSASVAEVDDGTVTGAGEGTATIAVKASSSHGATVSATASASVYTPVGEETFGVTTSGVVLRRAASTTAPSPGSLSKGASVDVSGVLGSWFYVAAGSVEGFLPVSAVTIPVVDLLLNRASVAVKPGDAVTLRAAVVPSLATVAGVTWSSANPKIATVTSGKVSGVKVGSTTVTATAGGKSVTIPVGVSLEAPPARNDPPPDLAPATSALVLVSMGANQATLSAYAWGQGTSRYQLQHRVAGGTYRNVTAAFTGNLGTATKLIPGFDKASLGKIVSYRLVKLQPGPGESAYSNTVSGVAGKPVLEATAEGGPVIKLRWAAMQGVKGYRIEAKNSKGKWVKLAHVTKASTTTQKVTKIGGVKLKAKKTYSFRMVACMKVSAKSCTEVKTAAKKALWSGTAQVWALSLKAKANAGKEITKMLKGTTKTGGLLYTKGTNFHTTALGKSAAHPYVKFVWDAKAGVLEFHTFLKFVVQGSAPKGSRSGSTMKTLVREGLQQVWGNHVVTGSKVDFVKDSQFATKVIIHEWDKRATEHHAATQKYLEIRIGSDDPCAKNWYSMCGNTNQGFKPGEQWIFLPWDTKAQYAEKPVIVTHGRSAFSAVGLKLTVAHEFGHVLGLADAYKEADGKPDRMMENSETTNNPGSNRYMNLMKSGDVYKASGRIAATVLEPNDYEMVLSAHRRGHDTPARKDSPASSYATHGSSVTISCEIVDQKTDEIKDGHWRDRDKNKGCTK